MSWKHTAPWRLSSRRLRRGPESVIAKPISSYIHDRRTPISTASQPNSHSQDNHQIHSITTTTTDSSASKESSNSSIPVQTQSQWPPSSTFASYNISIPPTSAQLSYANRFFTTSKPSFLTGSAKFRALPLSTVPEVAFLGRSNVGKSSILNALVQRSGTKLASVSSKPGRTKQMNAFGVGGVQYVSGRVNEDGTRIPGSWQGRGGLVVLDMPGYGKASRKEWGQEITKYLVGRRQLRRTFVLIDSEHGVKKSDLQLLDVLKAEGISHQVVLSKIDKLLFPRGKVTGEILGRNLLKMSDAIEEARGKMYSTSSRGVKPLDDILVCSAEKEVPPNSGVKLGIDNLRWSVLAAAGLDCDVNGAARSVYYEVEAQDEGTGEWDFVSDARQAG